MITKKMRKSSRAKSNEKKAKGYGTPTYILDKTGKSYIAKNRAAKRSEAKREKMALDKILRAS